MIRFVWIVLLETIVEVSAQVHNFVSMIENQCNSPHKPIKTDNGLETMLRSFYA